MLYPRLHIGGRKCYCKARVMVIRGVNMRIHRDTNTLDRTEISLVLFAVSIPILSPIIRPTKTMSSGRSGPSGGGVIMNTFNSRKLKKSNGSSNTDEGDFELLEESHGYMHNNNSSDVGPPPSKTYDYSISRHNQAEQNFSTPGIKRELTVSVTRNTGYGDREF